MNLKGDPTVKVLFANKRYFDVNDTIFPGYYRSKDTQAIHAYARVKNNQMRKLIEENKSGDGSVINPRIAKEGEISEGSLKARKEEYSA